MVRAGALTVSVLFLLAAAAPREILPPRPTEADRAAAFVWDLPEGFPVPRVPPDNPMSAAKVELGRLLFHDKRLSGDGTIACASCHRPERAYTDGRARAVGIDANRHPRSAMSLTNVAYNATLGWDDPALTRLEDQALIPMLNTNPLEMGIFGREAVVLARIRAVPNYSALLREAFPDDAEPLTLRNLAYALAAFERTLISGRTPYDRWAFGGEVDVLETDQRAGARLFFSQRLGCFRCHAGFNFSGPVVFEGSDDATPTLRNIALTAPYMHDGSIPTLEAAVDHYAAGGRARSAHPDNPAVDTLMTGFELTPGERRQVVAFLHALTDPAFVRRAQLLSRP